MDLDPQSKAVVDAINAIYPEAATAPDSATVAVHLPAEFAGREVSFISELGTIEVTADIPARVVINERTGP